MKPALRAVQAAFLILALAACRPVSVLLTPTEPAAGVSAPALPPPYPGTPLNPLDTPHAYLTDTCHYLRNKWKPTSAPPGTVVMVITFKEMNASSGLEKLVTELRDQEFKAIDTKQLLGFLERNARIPPRSVLLVQEGNFPARDFEDFYRPLWDQYGWPVVNAWVSSTETSAALLQDNEQLEVEGWVDHQAMGVIDTTLMSDETSKVIIMRELRDPLEVFADHFSKIPYAFIWPNGGFGLRPVQAARQLGYQLGFTANMRGPLMYNWVPLADQADPMRPFMAPEGQIRDPLMTLPRYPAELASDYIDQVRLVGQEAAAYAQANKPAEMAYYDAVCSAALGPIPISP